MQSLLFYLLVFFLPTQFGKHFWPSFSYVHGFRLDYLAPTLYVTDILSVGFIVITFVKNPTLLRKKSLIFSLLSITFLAVCNSLISAVPLSSLYGWVKIVEYFLLGLCLASFLKKKYRVATVYISTASALLQAILGILQFINQSSIGGLFYFLGERTFTASTPGIATMSMQGEVLLRPYGTFSHPNVFAFYLLVVSMLLFWFLTQNHVAKYKRMLLIGCFSILAIMLFLTFSRVIIILFIVSLLIYSFFFLKRYVAILLGSIVLVGIVGSNLFFVRLTETFQKDFFLRADLVTIAFDLFIKHPLLGVGLNNFYYHEIAYQKNFSPVFLQPVHNIYLLTLSQIGIIGFGVVLISLSKVYSNLHLKFEKSKAKDKAFYCVISLLLVSIGIAGLFDHYFVTLQQGQLLFALVIALSFV